MKIIIIHTHTHTHTHIYIFSLSVEHTQLISFSHFLLMKISRREILHVWRADPEPPVS
jgi:hypothetical protein